MPKIRSQIRPHLKRKYASQGDRKGRRIMVGATRAVALAPTVTLPSRVTRPSRVTLAPTITLTPTVALASQPGHPRLNWLVDRVLTGLCLLLLASTTVLITSTYLQIPPFASAYAAGGAAAGGYASRHADMTPSAPPAPGDIRLDSRLPVQSFSGNAAFNNVNAKFGSRFDFNVSPETASVYSGTDGIFHDNAASYIVGVAPAGEQRSFIFHMGALNVAQGDAYVQNERWVQGLDTTRWTGEAGDGSGLHIVVDLIDTFLGEPGCTAISSCAEAVRDDTVPVLIAGISVQNFGQRSLAGDFLFGSNRLLSSNNTCTRQQTPGGTAVQVLSYAPVSDVAGGTLFLAGTSDTWHCNTDGAGRSGLAWPYRVGPLQTRTAYLILGGWNGRRDLFQNTQLPASCQLEGLYMASEWSSQQAVVDFAFDNLFTGNRLLARAQAMEDMLIENNVLTPAQRWVIADALRSYKASSWLVGRTCPAGGYDAAVYEGTYGFLTTVDVLHEYGYFEINRVPWFFRSELNIVFKNATSNAFGTYFQHDQGSDVSGGACVSPGSGQPGLPTIRSTCYIPQHLASQVPMPVEENDDVTLLLAYYASVTGDTAMVAQHIDLFDAAMQHNLRVGDPASGIAQQDTPTTFDAASDCLHNDGAGAGNMYYQGLKEATGYRAAAFLDNLVPGDPHAATWNAAAAKIEGAMVREYNTLGYVPIANNSAFTNCDGRSVLLGEGLFYAHLIGLDRSMNQTLLRDLAGQYLADLRADTLAPPSSPSLPASRYSLHVLYSRYVPSSLFSPSSQPIVTLQSSRASGAQCASGHCLRYEWFSKVMLSGLVADLVYTGYGCKGCSRLDLAQEVYTYNATFPTDFGDGIHEDGSGWGGRLYPRGIISWAYLSQEY